MMRAAAKTQKLPTQCGVKKTDLSMPTNLSQKSGFQRKIDRKIFGNIKYLSYIQGVLKQTDKNIIISTLSNTLGSYSSLKGNELAFYCPFCNHHKQKLQVNTETQKWHCWTCNSGGKKLTSLLKKLDVDRKTISIIREIYGDSNYNPQLEDADTKVFISLPKEFKSLNEVPNGFNPEYKHAMHYLTQRGITEKDIIKYNIGYCTEGLYSRRVIIPSYNSDGSLNYFVSRSYYPEEKMKYKNPPISKNVICFDSQVMEISI